MRLLLDTHVFLWWCGNDARLSRELRKKLTDPRVIVHVSAASAWEIAIKQALGRLRIPEPVEKAVAASGFLPLDITFEHARVAGGLPDHHRDPFDRMLVAQAQVEGLALATYDARLAPYGVTRVS